MRDRTLNQKRLDKNAYDRRIEDGMVPAPRTRRERRALARHIVKTRPEVLEGVMNSTVETTDKRMGRSEAKKQAVRLISGILLSQQYTSDLVEVDNRVQVTDVGDGVGITESGLVVPTVQGLAVPA